MSADIEKYSTTTLRQALQRAADDHPNRFSRQVASYLVGGPPPDEVPLHSQMEKVREMVAALGDLPAPHFADALLYAGALAIFGANPPEIVIGEVLYVTKMVADGKA